MQFKDDIILSIDNFLKHPIYKVVLITGQSGSEFKDLLVEHISQKTQFVVFIDNLCEANIRFLLHDVPFNKPAIFVFFAAMLENLYVKYSLEQWMTKVIVVCANSLLHPTLDPSVYFAPIKGNHVQRKFLLQIKLLSSRQYPTLVPKKWFEIPVSNKCVTSVSLQTHFLNNKLMSTDSPMMQMLADWIIRDDNYKVFMFKLVSASRDDDQMKIAAANAITVLNFARVPFSNMDLSNINIEHANLEGGIFDRTNFKNANLKNARMVNAFIGDADLSNCLLESCELGELPYLDCDTSINIVCFSPNEQFLAVAHKRGAISLWELDSRRYINIFKLDSPETYACAIHFIIERVVILVVTSFHRKFYFDILTGDEITEVVEPNDSKLSKSQRDLYNNTLAVFKKTDHTQLRTDEIGLIKESICFSKDGRWLAAGTSDTIMICDCYQNTQLSCVDAVKINAIARCINFSHDGSLLASGCNNNIYIWSVAERKCIKILMGHFSRIRSIRFSSNGKLLVSGGEDGKIRLWNLTANPYSKPYNNHTASILDVDFCPGSLNLASSSEDGLIKIWHSRTGYHQRTLKQHKFWVSSISFSPDGKWLLSADFKDEIILWDLYDNNSYALHHACLSTVNQVKFSPNNQLFATANYYSINENENRIYLWSVIGRQPIKTFKGHTCVCFSPDSQFLATTDEDDSILLWNIDAQTCIKLGRHEDMVTCISVSPDGRYLISGDRKNMIRVWDRTHYNNIQLKGHTGVIEAIDISPDSKFFASGSGDKTVHLWSLETFSLLNSLSFSNCNIKCVKFNNDGSLLAVGADDSAVTVWKKDTNSPINYSLLWTTQPTLFCKNVKIDNVRGMSKLNLDLLLQQGAIANANREAVAQVFSWQSIESTDDCSFSENICVHTVSLVKDRYASRAFLIIDGYDSVGPHLYLVYLVPRRVEGIFGFFSKPQAKVHIKKITYEKLLRLENGFIYQIWQLSDVQSVALMDELRNDAKSEHLVYLEKIGKSKPSHCYNNETWVTEKILLSGLKTYEKWLDFKTWYLYINDNQNNAVKLSI